MADTITQSLTALRDIITANPRQTALTTTTAVLTLSTLWVLLDYRAWTAFGTGGTPPTPSGYWRMTKIRLARLLASDSLTDASVLDATTPSFLPADFTTRNKRSGPRPKSMSRTMPQRQVPYPPASVPEAVTSRVANLMSALASSHPDLVELRPSKTEGGSTDAIFALPADKLASLNPIGNEKRNALLGREIAHAHPSEGSLHVWLSQADARKVVESGWGERFPLAFVDKGWTMVYAPRDEAEVGVVEEVVRAGVAFLCGKEI